MWCSIAKATVAVVSHHKVSPRLARQCGAQEMEKGMELIRIAVNTAFATAVDEHIDGTSSERVLKTEGEREKKV